MKYPRYILWIIGFGSAAVLCGCASPETHRTTPSDATIAQPLTAVDPRESFVAPDAKAAPMTITFVGDMNFDRHIRTVAERAGTYNGLIDAKLRAHFATQTCVVGNLEGPITAHASVSQRSAMGEPNNFRFTFDPAVVTFLADANFCAVNIGNNHIGNFGMEGIAATRAFMRESPVEVFGDAGDDVAQRWIVKNFNGYRVAFVNDNLFVADGHTHALSDVRAARAAADTVIVYTHWGTEYVAMAGAHQRQQARELIDAGADAVIGSHPHVVQDTETYGGKTIYYSLGNFIFDQYFRPDTQKGLIVTVTIDPSTGALSFRDDHVTMRANGTTFLQ